MNGLLPFDPSKKKRASLAPASLLSSNSRTLGFDAISSTIRPLLGIYLISVLPRSSPFGLLFYTWGTFSYEKLFYYVCTRASLPFF